MKPQPVAVLTMSRTLPRYVKVAGRIRHGFRNHPNPAAYAAAPMKPPQYQLAGTSCPSAWWMRRPSWYPTKAATSSSSCLGVECPAFPGRSPLGVRNQRSILTLSTHLALPSMPCGIPRPASGDTYPSDPKTLPWSPAFPSLCDAS